MLLMTENELLDRFNTRIQSANQIDVAVAWANECNALDALKTFAASGRVVRAIVGIAGNATHPNALRTLQKCAKLRIHNSIDGLFHPKLYIFHENGTRYCWIGSANLTRAGFEQNSELVFESEDVGGAAREWFETCWGSLADEEFSGQLLDNYERNWKPPQAWPRIEQAYDQRLDGRRKGEFAESVSDWASFIVQLAEAEVYWGAKWNRESPITGEGETWLETITVGQRVVRREDWSTLSREDRYVLLGRDPYGQLGSMRGAGLANNIFRVDSPENVQIRRQIRKALQPCITATDTRFAEVACDFIEEVSSIEGFAGALATRLLALARPDRAVSVNRGSSAKFATLSGLPQTSLAKAPRNKGKSYLDLLHWLEQQEWYSNPQPQGPREKLYASVRAALFDALVYEWDG
ncbi:PLD-like domain-containing protein [Bradyrhizobium erythrophlei]|nr:PLD-like domain-containing protein [Bradyrhizobium erythrophlei]